MTDREEEEDTDGANRAMALPALVIFMLIVCSAGCQAEPVPAVECGAVGFLIGMLPGALLLRLARKSLDASEKAWQSALITRLDADRLPNEALRQNTEGARVMREFVEQLEAIGERSGIEA